MRTFRLIVAFVLVGMFLGTAVVATTQEVASPEASPVAATITAGLRGSAARYFTPASSGDSGVIFVEARVAEFETAGQAIATIPLWLEQAERSPSDDRYTVEMFPVGVETIADASQLTKGNAVLITDDDYVYDIMALAVADDTLLFTFVVWSTYDVGESEIVGLAKRTLGISPLEYEPVLGVDYETGGLWDLLPRIEHMPQGLTWNNDNAPCIGVFGINECPEG